MRYSCLAAGVAAAVGALSVASTANAQACPTGTTIYANGSSAQAPYIAVLSQIFLAQTPPVNLVYQSTASCTGVTAVTTPTPSSASITYWTAPATMGGKPVANTCTPNTPVTVDVGVSDVYSATCNAGVSPVPADQKEFSGPIQAMTMVVNPSSNQHSISEEAAHVVFKDLGTTFMVTPWTSGADIWIRPGGPTGSGTRFMIGSALGMGDTDWSSALTNDTGNSTSVLTGVSGDTANANASLGILSVTNTDPNRSGTASTTPVMELAFQAKGQSCGYLPDSSAMSFDKLNVREGRYVIWGPGHYITAVSNAGVPMSSSAPADAPTNAAVAYLIKLVTFDKSLNDADAMTSITAAATAPGLVPDCAMHVQRTGEVTDTPIEYSYVPPEGSCGCFWESQTSTAAPAGCNACPTTGTCATKFPATPVCRYGYCEAF
jgi:hypothetical protein